MATEKTLALLEEIKSLTILEMADLVKALEEEFGVSAAAPVAAVAVAAPAADAPAAEAEQTEFDVILKDAGPTKMDVIKAVKEVTGVSLMDAKKLVDAAPSTIKEKVSKEDADAAEAKLKAAGATVEIK